MEPATPTSAVASPPADPPKDPPAKTLPENIEVLLHVTRHLLGYGRRLVDTIRQRAAAPGFNAIAACFGTSNLSTILAHLNRGLLRCAALERDLLARAAAGRDIPYIERRPRAHETTPDARAPRRRNRPPPPPRPRNNRPCHPPADH